jgi:uncharacterized membrane protein
MAHPHDAAAPPEQASLFEDLIDILFTPSKVFARRGDKGFWLVLLIVTVLIGVVYVASRGVLDPIFEAEYQRQVATAMEQNPALTAEQIGQGRRFAEMAMTYAVFLVVPIAILVIGFLTWAVGKVLGADLALKGAMGIAAFAYVPRVIETVFNLIQGMVMDVSGMRGRYHLSLGVGRFLDPDTTSLGMIGLLGRIDLFTLWVTVLIGIGLSVMGGISRSKGMSGAAIIWACGALPAIWTLVNG